MAFELLTALALSGLSADPAALGAKDEPRVKVARAAHADAIAKLFAERAVPYPAPALLIRVFKLDDTLELWAPPKKGAPYVLLKSYPICARSGVPGPKRREGDLQVPEGFYRISGFNPTSNFLLSMRVDYPNEADRLRNKAPRRSGHATTSLQPLEERVIRPGGHATTSLQPLEERVIRLGGDIFIHGSCVTIGCVPLGDEAISELYVIARDAARAGAKVDAHLFPARLDVIPETEDAELRAFWEELRPGYVWFEEHKTIPKMSVDPAGRYVLKR